MTITGQRGDATGRGAAVAPLALAIVAALVALAGPTSAMPPPGDPQVPPRISAELVYTLAVDAPAGAADPVISSVLRRARLVGNTLATAEIISIDTVTSLMPHKPGGVMHQPDGTLMIAGSGNAALCVDPRTGLVTPRPACDHADFDQDQPPTIRDLCADAVADRAWAIADRPMVAGLTIAPVYGPGRATPLDGDDDNITGLAFTSIIENHQPFQRVFYAAEIPPFAPGGEPVRCLGFINTLTGQTIRVFVNLPAARAIAHDPHTGDVLLAGGHYLAQVDAHATTPHIVAMIDLSTAIEGGATLDLIDITTDGNGRAFAVSADGRLLALDYADIDGDPTEVQINDGAVQMRLFTLEDPPAPDADPLAIATIRGLAPLSGPGGPRAGITDCLWDNGAADGINGQLSQVSAEQGHPQTADDVYFCPGRIYRLDTLTATLSSNTVFPKARLEIYDDCNGMPGDLIGAFDTFDLTPTGEIIDQTYTVYNARFLLGGIYVDGGRDGRSLWISVRGVGLGSGLEEWFWQTSGERVIKGRSGLFRSAAHGYPDWTPIDGFGCGCSDFAFQLYGHGCKVLIDGGPADIFAEPAGVLSQIASDADTARVADDFVIPPCEDIQTICYVRAYVFSNCTPVRGQFELYDDACGEPDTPVAVPPQPVYRAAFERVTDLSYTVMIGGESMTLYAVEAFDLNWPMLPGRNYWLAPVGDTSFSLRKRTYAAFGKHCDAPIGSDGRACLSRFSPARANGRGLNLTRWTPIVDHAGTSRDLAMLVAIENIEIPTAVAPVEACPADQNRDGTVGLSDLFDYLNAWFTGCP